MYRQTGISDMLCRCLLPVLCGVGIKIHILPQRRPENAPGTGTPEVGDFTSYETLELVRALTPVNFVGFDIVEVLPAYDHGEITSYMAANIVFEFLSILALQKNRR